LRLKSQVKQAKITEERASFQQKTIHTRLRQAIEQAYVNMRTAYERYQKLEQQVTDYKESFRSATIRFEAGVITSVDYTIAKNNFDHAATNLVASRYDYLLKTKILDYYQGK
jgi:outer membrane protein